MGRKNMNMPRSVYHQCMWVVKDMDRLRKMEAAYHTAQEDEATFFEDDDFITTDIEVLRKAKEKLECIRDAIGKVPVEYRQTTIESIVYNLPFTDMAHSNTWRRWRQVFIYELARNLMLI